MFIIYKKSERFLRNNSLSLRDVFSEKNYKSDEKTFKASIILEGKRWKMQS